MHKFLIAITLIFCTHSALAKSCTGGTIITGYDTTRSFCISNNNMNWWTAHQWCVGNGRVLAHPDNLCTYKEGWFIGNGGCPNFSNKQDLPGGWTSLSVYSNSALIATWAQISAYQRDDRRFRAICE